MGRGAKKDMSSRNTKSIWDYLSTRFEPEQLDMLYEDTFTVLTIFGSLPPLAKQYVFRLLAVETRVPKDLLDSWVKTNSAEGSQQAHEYALNRLYDLRVFFKYKETKSWILANPKFRLTLTRALCTPTDSSVETREKVDKQPPSLDTLAQFSKTRWESMLYFMVGETTVTGPPPLEVQQRLEKTNLMERQEGKLVVSSEGFRFLFKGLKSQLWEILVTYMNSVDERKLDRNEVLTFVFRLSFMKLGQGYPVTALTQAQRIVLQDLALFGFIWQRSVTSSRYYPTSLALALSAAEQDPQRQGGFVIAEKSFKIYAYTSSAFQRALLGLFCILHFLLPNMVVGIITRESVNRAFRIGITAKEIVNYLEQSAHPAMREEAKKTDSLFSVPENVSHQIELWEGEIYRHTEEPASLCEMFKSNEEYVQIRDFLRKKNILLWSSDEKMILVLREAGMPLLKEFRQQQVQPPIR